MRTSLETSTTVVVIRFQLETFSRMRIPERCRIVIDRDFVVKGTEFMLFCKVKFKVGFVWMGQYRLETPVAVCTTVDIIEVCQDVCLEPIPAG